MSGRNWKLIKTILIIGTVLAALKLIFVDYTLDEEYQIVMSYRNLRGDHLFREMWEPHQTSAFLCSGLMWLYMTVTGTSTGIVLYLRFVTLGIQLLLTYALYRTLLRYLEKDYSFLLALLFFNITPKNIQIPDFSNMQLWFLAIPVLLLMYYYAEKNPCAEQETAPKDRWYLLIPAGIALSCEILTYPTCIILFPFLLVWLFRSSGQQKVRDCLILTGTCAVCGGIWISSVLQHVTIPELLQNVENLLSFDPTHHVSGMTSDKSQNYIDNIILWIVWCAIIALVSTPLYLLWKRFAARKNITLTKPTRRLCFMIIALLVSQPVQLYYWIFAGVGYEYLQIHLLILILTMLVAWPMAGDFRHPLFWGIAATGVAYAGVMYISDLALYYTLPHGALGLVFATAIVLFALQNLLKDHARPWILTLVISLCLCSIAGKGFALRGGKTENTILSIGGIMKGGPAVGILSDYMGAYIYNKNYAEYEDHVQEGDNVLIVANMIMSAGTTSYLFENVDVCHFSVVDPTTYDERLLTYWEQYPEKAPDVIVVDCWYGVLQEHPDNWIMQYIENDFGYTYVGDASYVRFYRR